MADFIHTIDWRDEFDQLTPYLEGQGGIVRIQYRGVSCAHFPFLTTLKSQYESTDTHRSIRIDREVYSVRYLTDIRDEFIRKIGMELPTIKEETQPPAPVKIANDIKAKGDIEISIENVTVTQIFNGENSTHMTQDRNAWIDALCDEVGAFLHKGRMMVVINHGSPEDQNEFWRHIWKDGLERLTDSGLLLVHMVDIDDNANIHDLAPNTPNVTITLPASLSRSAQEHAIEDLTKIIISEIPAMSEDDACKHAQTLVFAHDDDIPRLHRKYAGVIMSLGRHHG